ncbi:hypothetical protein [Nocardioides sp. J54]|uniref:hypothetical protein n=1 Tax=Nocardioides sp. J54 TaxID=935866 RepID=UPI000491662B|nr:hypothetical protein [Nocardioides sp. J54]
MKNLAPYAKALVAAATAAIAFAIPIVDDGLKPSEVLGIIGAGLAGLGIVYAVPNRTEPKHRAEPGLIYGDEV